MNFNFRKSYYNFLNLFYKNRIIFNLYKLYNKSYLKLFFNYIRFLEIDRTPYLIYPGKNLVYIPIPKVASSSITEVLHTKGDFNSYFRTNLNLKNNNFYIFSFVRNPFLRIISSYDCCVKHPTDSFGIKYYEKIFKKTNISFEDYVRSICKISDNFSDGHFKSQFSILNKNKTNLCIDYIGKIENLNSDFNFLKKKFNLEKLPLKNSSKKRNKIWQDYYTLELSKLIYLRYKKDFELWYPEEYLKLKTYLENKNKDSIF